MDMTGTYIGFSMLGLIGVGILIYAAAKKDVGLVAGVGVAMLWTGLLVFGAGSNGGGEVVATVVEEDFIELEELPEVKTIEEEPEIIESDSADDVPLEFAPPMQADVPSTMAVSTFVQRLQPPPPPSTPQAHGQLTIPVNRNPPVSKLANLIDLKDLDQQPTPTYQVPPNYPYEMKRQGISGSVTLAFIVDSKGIPLDIYVVSSTHAEFEQPAIQALQKWKFRPGRKGGKAVNTKKVVQLLKFNLSDS